MPVRAGSRLPWADNYGLSLLFANKREITEYECTKLGRSPKDAHDLPAPGRSFQELLFGSGKAPQHLPTKITNDSESGSCNLTTRVQVNQKLHPSRELSSLFLKPSTAPDQSTISFNKYEIGKLLHIFSGQE